MKIDKFSGANAFLSNFHPAVIEFEGITFPSSEHAFQAAKTHDQEDRLKISRLDTPGKAKRAGKKVALREGWNEIRVQIMEEILRIKFSNPDLAAKLKATGEAELEEGNTWNDTFWGVCRGKGQNNLGKILMKIRAEI